MLSEEMVTKEVVRSLAVEAINYRRVIKELQDKIIELKKLLLPHVLQEHILKQSPNEDYAKLGEKWGPYSNFTVTKEVHNGKIYKRLVYSVGEEQVEVEELSSESLIARTQWLAWLKYKELSKDW